jgi:hypothetical protein
VLTPQSHDSFIPVLACVRFNAGPYEANDHSDHRNDQDENLKGSCGVHGDFRAGRWPGDMPVSPGRPEQRDRFVYAIVLREEGLWGS